MVKLIDIMMTTIQKGKCRYHGTAYSFKYREDLVYVSYSLKKVGLNGIHMNFTNEEFDAVREFMCEERSWELTQWK